MGTHKPPAARNPRPKGAQKGVVRRGHQNSTFNFGSARSPMTGGCLVSLALLPFLLIGRALGLGRR